MRKSQCYFSLWLKLRCDIFSKVRAVSSAEVSLVVTLPFTFLNTEHCSFGVSARYPCILLLFAKLNILLLWTSCNGDYYFAVIDRMQQAQPLIGHWSHLIDTGVNILHWTDNSHPQQMKQDVTDITTAIIFFKCHW